MSDQDETTSEIVTLADGSQIERELLPWVDQVLRELGEPGSENAVREFVLCAEGDGVFLREIISDSCQHRDPQ